MALKKVEEKLKYYINVCKELNEQKRKLTKELKEAMKIIKAQKAAGSTINQDCMTGRCEDHRRELMGANVEYYGDINKLKQKLYMSWIAFGIMGALLIYFRKFL